MRVTEKDIEFINYGYYNKLEGASLERMYEIHSSIGDNAFQEINIIIAKYAQSIREILDKTSNS